MRQQVVELAREQQRIVRLARAEMRDLRRCVHARVGASGAADVDLAEDVAWRRAAGDPAPSSACYPAPANRSSECLRTRSSVCKSACAHVRIRFSEICSSSSGTTATNHTIRSRTSAAPVPAPSVPASPTCSAACTAAPRSATARVVHPATRRADRQLRPAAELGGRAHVRDLDVRAVAGVLRGLPEVQVECEIRTPGRSGGSGARRRDISGPLAGLCRLLRHPPNPLRPRDDRLRRFARKEAGLDDAGVLADARDDVGDVGRPAAPCTSRMR